MNESKHTPGPLGVEHMFDVENACDCLRGGAGTDDEWTAIGPLEDDGCCEVVGPYTAYCHPMNANLYAAAPDLLVALEDVREWVAFGTIRGVHYDEMSVCDQIDSVLARMKGITKGEHSE